MGLDLVKHQRQRHFQMGIDINKVILVLLFSINVSCSSNISSDMDKKLNCTIKDDSYIFITHESLYLILDLKKRVFRFKPESFRFESRGKFNDIKNLEIIKNESLYLLNIDFKKEYLNQIPDEKFAKELAHYQFGVITIDCKNQIEKIKL